MPARRYTCPECEAIIRRAEPVPDGKKIRCPECDTVFRPPVDDEPPMPASRKRKANRDDDDDRPRKKSKGKKKKQNNNATLIGIVVLAAVLLLVGGPVAYFVFIKKEEDPNKNNPVVANNQKNPRFRENNNPLVQPQANPNAGAKGGNGKSGVQVGNTAIDIEGEDIDGQPFKLSDYRGKVVLLDFWGNW